MCDVIDSHVPNLNIQHTSPHLRATHCVATNCVGSEKTKIVTHGTKGSNENGHNIVGDSHAPIYHSMTTNCAESSKMQIVTHEIKGISVNGHNIVGDPHAPIYHITPHSRATNCAGSAITQIVTHETKKNDVNGHNIVGDSHAPIYNINQHLTATHGVTTNCVKSAKSEVVPHVARENSVNVHNVVGDSHVTSPNIAHTLSHLRATHCVASQVCDGTDTSDTGSQGHGYDSSFDSSCSNQSCNNVVGDSHLQDQQEESDEKDNGESESNSPTESESEPEQSQITRNSVKIVHWNTQGANGKVAEIQAAVIDHDIDILLLQDTRFKPRADGIAPLRVDGYHTYHIPQREEPTKCHGLITLVHFRLPSSIMDIVQIGQSTEVLSVKVWINKRPLDIHNIYRTEPFAVDLKPILNSGHRVLIAGDYNARHESWCRATNASGSILRNQLDESNNCILLNHPQVWTTTNDSVLDLAICSPSLAAITDWDTLPELTSDHIAVQITINSAFTYSETNATKKYVTKHADWQIYREELTALLTNIDTSGTMEDNIETLYEAISKAASKAMPTTPVKKYTCQYWRKNPGVQFAKRLANQATRKHRKHPTPESKTAMKEAYKQYENVCTQVKYFSWYRWATETNECTTSAQIWSKIRRCMGVPPREPTHRDPKGRANELCTTFAARCSSNNLSQATQAQLRRLLPERQALIQEAIQEDADTDRDISLEELEQSLKSKDTSPGEDGVTYSMIFEMPRRAKLLLLKIFNRSLRTGRIPSEWKTARIKPIPKGDGNFRPISLLPCMTKILDRIIVKRLLYSAKPVHNMAVGFRKGVGTQDAFTTLIHNLSYMKKQESGAVFIDIEKAFEMVDKHVILSNLVKAGVKGRILKWLENFLSDRKAFVLFQNKKSDTLTFEKGIPQGSSLSPTLFNYAANSLLETELPRCVKMHSYADDFVMYISHRHEHIARERLQTALDRINLKMQDLGLKLSEKKTEAMWMSITPPIWKLRINNQQVAWSKSVKYLGVMVDCKLNFHEQSDYVKERALKRLTCLRVLSALSGVNSKILLTVYTGCIKPILEYGSQIICMMPLGKQMHLQKVEHSALRLILRVPRWTAINALYHECHMLPFVERCEVNLVKLMVKIISDDQHPLHKAVKRIQDRQRDAGSTKSSWIRQARIIFHKLAPNVPISKELHDTPPPWQKSHFNRMVDDSVTKATTSREVLAERAEARIQEMQRFVHYYTDGSVDDQLVGAAFYCAGSHGHKRLSNGCSILQAELYGIKMAMQHAVRYGGVPVINVDSRSAISALCKPTQSENQELVRDIKQLADRADGKPTLHWVPSHCGITGNEEADTLAKQALLNQEVEVTLPISRQLMARKILHKALDLHETALQQNQAWQNRSCSKLKATHAERQGMLKIIDRRTQRQIYKLRCFCYTNDYILLSTETRCHFCNGTYKIAAIHFLQECPALIRRREQLLEFIENPQRDKVVVDILNSQAKRNNKELVKFINHIKL